MKKITLNREKLNEKKFNLIKEKISDLNDFESSKIVGGTPFGYLSGFQRCKFKHTVVGVEGCRNSTAVLQAGCHNW